jgi:tetratricopeptide (TPR) repeat protein
MSWHCTFCGGTGAIGTVTCALCKGTGRSQSGAPAAPGAGTSPSESVRAFDGHLERLLGDAGARTPDAVDDDWSSLSEIDLVRRLIDVDGRYMREMLDARPGRVSTSTPVNIAQIAEDYRRIAARGPTPLINTVAIERKVADCVRLQGQAYEWLDDLDAAETSYEDALRRYRELEAVDEAMNIERSLRELRLHRDRDVDAALTTLRAKLEAPGLSEVDRAEVQVDLAELHLTRDDEVVAEELFRAAEQALAPRLGDVTGAATARSLMASLLSIRSGEASSEVPILDVVRVQGLLGRVYAGMTQLLRESEPTEAARYLGLRNEMEGSVADGSSMNKEFSETMLQSLDSFFEQYDRDD